MCDAKATRPAAPAARARARLYLPAHLRARIADWAQAGHPHETCGMLIGSVLAARTETMEVALARNLERERPRERYRMDPADQLAAELRARELGLAVVGIWHSHPDQPALPSQTDRAAAHEGYSYLILSVNAHGVQDARSFRLTAGRFVEEQLAS